MGTSIAAPLWASFTALVNQQLAFDGGQYAGFINPAIYSIGNNPSLYNSDFNDIKAGPLNNNEWPDSPNKYLAETGYDLCTGWGSPIGQALINYFSSNLYWAKTRTISLSMTIPAGVTLTIEPGTNVQFANGASLTVNGVLKASGTTSQPITFTSTGSTSPGSWGNIVLSGSGANNSTLSNVNFQYGSEIDVENVSNVTIQNCNISKNSGDAIYFYSSTGSVKYNTISSTSGCAGIDIANGSTVTSQYNSVFNPN
jgi:parallel beta-helix repeat protein